MAPELPATWTWIAATNVALKSGKRTNVFFYDSWVGTSEQISTNGRKRDFPNDITAKVASNAYHIAFQREFVAENETFLFIVSPKKQKVVVELPKEIFKTKRRLEYDMEAWEAKFIHVVVPPSEHRQVVWKPEPKTAGSYATAGSLRSPKAILSGRKPSGSRFGCRTCSDIGSTSTPGP